MTINTCAHLKHFKIKSTFIIFIWMHAIWCKPINFPCHKLTVILRDFLALTQIKSLILRALWSSYFLALLSGKTRQQQMLWLFSLQSALSRYHLCHLKCLDSHRGLQGPSLWYYFLFYGGLFVTRWLPHKHWLSQKLLARSFLCGNVSNILTKQLHSFFKKKIK